MHEFNDVSLETRINLALLETLSERVALEQWSLEAFFNALPTFPTPITVFQTNLFEALYSDNRVSLEAWNDSSNAVRSALILESLEELTRAKAKEIVTGSKSVLDWLYHVLDHLHETTDKFMTEIATLEHRLEPYKHTQAAKGSFIYKSIPRNLSTKGQIQPNSIPIHLDEFLTKSKKVRESCQSKEFHTLLDSLKSFKSLSTDEENTKNIENIFDILKKYLKTILPDETIKSLKHLDQIEGRILMYDPQEYISDHRFYSYLPTTPEGAVSTVTSGIIRTNQTVDLNQEIPYLSARESQAILDVVKKHLHDFNDHDKFKAATLELREIQTSLFEKYSKAKRMRKDSIDAKPYVMMMNICAGLVYGMHVKALNKSISIITACLRYVSKSIKAQEVQQNQTPLVSKDQ